MSQIKNLIAFAKADTTNISQEINFGNVSNVQGQSINAATGLRVNGAKKVLSSYAINHILKSHGVGTKQSERGQKDIVESDFELIPAIFSTPDVVEKGHNNSRGAQALKFYKEIKGFKYCVVVAIINDGEHGLKLNVNTMYAKK